MSAGNEHDALLRVADELCAELGFPEADADFTPAGSQPNESGRITPVFLPPDAESAVNSVRGCLGKIAAAVEAREAKTGNQRAVCAALDGAEMVMRGELARGSAEQLPSLMPSFVFLVTLPILEQDEALDLARRASELIERALGG